jgi:hypothetical protein
MVGMQIEGHSFKRLNNIIHKPLKTTEKSIVEARIGTVFINHPKLQSTMVYLNSISPHTKVVVAIHCSFDTKTV